MQILLISCLMEWLHFAPVRGEFVVTQQSGTGIDRGNAVAKRDDQARQEQVTMRQRAV